ncbi:Frequency clock protein [Cytospora mali]|uniref:Frequency clock protein n=1 Tax=Cytospora mali TaxID=578113 RepID=A0A194VCG3_CYTMA|nr:Frequency clock protein [Valsa mali var. pyri (nom. inval.)]
MMPNSQGTLQGSQPLPPNARGHPMPRRASPENSVTLRHHRLARDASMKPPSGTNTGSGSPPRRDSSGESHATGQSDPKKWFDRSNRNAPAAFDHATMDVDPPFYQKQSDSSNEELNNPGRESAYPYVPSALRFDTFRPTMEQSSSAEDFRSVIDDLTIENKRLKEALKKYKQFGRDLLREDKLFELKIHGLPRTKKRELEATLRDFASSLEGSPAESSHRAKKSSKHVDRLKGSISNSKHASSSSSRSRPVDSAYASMSTGPSSIGLTNASSGSFSRPWLARARSAADQKVESYLQDIPEGLFPRPVVLTEKDKKKLVVRRLEQLFTGKTPIPKRDMSRNQSVTLDAQTSGGALSVPAQAIEPSREARIQSPELGQKRNTREDMSMEPSNCEDDTQGDLTSGNATSERTSNDNSPPTAELPEQRATRPRDLDPDRAQVPSENMQYIRHLGVTAPEYLSQTRFRPQDVSMDEEGWIHLNLLCSLAQLHILNVTPDYIRSAVSERSAKFQLSRDGRKIRWRGGMEGTKFSSDSSGDSSLRSPETEVTDVSNGEGQRKRQKTGRQASVASSRTQTKLRPQNPSEGFHYKPLFTRNRSSSEETSLDDTISEYGAVENSNLNSRSTGFVSGSGTPTRKKRRHDGAIIYYTGAPFCTDLSGDPGDLSPTTYMTSSGQEHESMLTEEEMPELIRTTSGSSLPYRPLVDGPEQMELSNEEPEFVTDDTDMSEDDDGFGFTWSDAPEKLQLKPLEAHFEPFGLGGVTPEDHFAVVVVTRHPINCLTRGRPGMIRLRSDETTASVASRIAALTTNSPGTPTQALNRACNVEFETIAKRYKKLNPLPLPPPAMFYPPFTDTTESEGSGFEDDYSGEESDGILDDSESLSPRGNPNQLGDVFGRMGALDSGEDEIMGSNSRISPKESILRKLSSDSIRLEGSFGKGVDLQPDSSGATAGEASGYSSSRSNMEEDE